MTTGNGTTASRKIYKPMPSWLFHNDGDGTFTDISKSSGIAAHPGKVWAFVATDINNDGRMDLFVTNDTVANSLFVNQGGGKFTENGTEAASPLRYGQKPVGHGVDSADFNQDGLARLVRRQH